MTNSPGIKAAQHILTNEEQIRHEYPDTAELLLKWARKQTGVDKDGGCVSAFDDERYFDEQIMTRTTGSNRSVTSPK